MASIQMRLRKTDQEFIESSYNRLVDEEGGEWYFQPLWFKRIETMDKSNSLFAEYSFDELPTHIKEQINKNEKEPDSL